MIGIDRQWSPKAREAYAHGQESGITARRLGLEQKSTTSQERMKIDVEYFNIKCCT